MALQALGVLHRVFVHNAPVKSLEQAARERGQRPEQIVRSILFRVSEGEYVLVLVAGPQQISWKALRKHLGRSRISLASAEEVLAITGYPIGAVGPVGLARPLKILVDSSILSEEEISIGSGKQGTAIILKTADLLNILGDFDVVHFIDSQATDSDEE